MLFIQNENTDPYFNLALEEYLLKEFKKDAPVDCFTLWQSEPCVVVGKNQSASDEINENYLALRSIKVARRLSGGGAVFHDLGNLNFTYVINDTENDLRNYRKFTTPIIETLAKLGVKAELSERNDILIEGLKFSGNAQYKHKNRLLHHGTILFSSSLEDVTLALKTDSKKSRWVKSTPSPVTNVQNHLLAPVSIDELKALINKQVASIGSGLNYYRLTPDDIKNISNLAQEKYATSAWIYQNLRTVSV